MQKVKTLYGEVIILLKTRTSEVPDSNGWRAFVPNQHIKDAHKSGRNNIKIFAGSTFVHGGHFTGSFGRRKDGYAIGCKRFSISAFNAILRNAGALRQYTKKAKAAGVGR